MQVARISTMSGQAGSAAPRVADGAREARARAGAGATTYVATATLGMGVRERFETLEERFLPAKAKGVDATWQFLLTGKDGGEWWVQIKDGKIKVIKGKGPKADVTIRATAENYLKVANDEVSPIKAFLTGMVKFEGDKGLAKKFKEYFRDPG